ncbi:MiaB/RimO family radical SAM methylthiotransferase [Candidatus Peregrinibacteria bacterium]|jgi:tRNA-2-methylthio-N6-dimethylallyladenosine synthase|nr:MiaB/RimO family radical SAM methylthiotransferase [Candidatus Peregrinibacteria bacterium]MBT7483779.1 MiaB/RimO family radical SAM methylthiotransferase [Candidatus Peregrinibacteria bacterium]MBT7703031.1 MiaB/RimO family radical SAM methylthiotransferase [Candidatus Peregrinibacteria bacterium]
MNKYFINTYGCQMNYSDTERLSAILEQLGYAPAQTENEADFVLFNTCSIRQKAEDRVYGQMRKLVRMKRERPNLLVGITGCMVRESSTINSEEQDKLLKQEPVDLVFKIDDLPKLGGLIKEVQPDFKTPISEGDLESYFHIAPKRESKVQVWVPIQTGCDKFCTYCIVPFARGRETSRPMQKIVDECAAAVESGAAEITLLGQTVDSYGISVQDKLGGRVKIDGEIPNVVFNQGIFKGENMMASSDGARQKETAERPFVTLLKEIDKLKAKGLKRLRYSSPHPQDFCEELIILHKELDTLQPWIHLPVQSGNNKVLKDMRRTYTREHYLNLIKLIKKHVPDCAISTDIIAGFPGETEEEFMESIDLMKEMECDMAFMAQYSPRRGTYSAKHLKDDVPKEEKARRFHMLNDTLTEISRQKYAQFMGQTVEVLVERQDGQRCSGRTPHYKEVFFNSGRDLVGKLVSVKVTKTDNFFLKGELV